MQQPQSQTNQVNVPINVGTVPDWNTRLGFPRLFNMFVGNSGYIYCTPGLQQDIPITFGRSVWYTVYKQPFYLIVTNTQIIRGNLEGTYSIIATITFSGLPVQIDENLQGQISIIDGLHLYVFDQNTNVFTVMGEDQGFSLKTPCSVVELNTFMIVLDKQTGTWVISDPNNALIYNPLNVIAQIQSQLTEAMSLATLNSNLYIFGLTGIERWEPNYNTNVYLFPFSRDNNFRRDIGLIGTAAIKRALDKVYFLSNKYTPMVLIENDLRSIAGEGSDIGISRIISQYPDVNNCICSFYSFRGNYFAHYTFIDTKISWVYCENSKTFALSDDLIVAAPDDIEAVLTETGLYSLTLSPNYKYREIIAPRIFGYNGQQTYRKLLNCVEVRMVQGELQDYPPQQNLELTISTDSLSWLNTVNRPIGLTGQRNYLCIWWSNIAAYEYTIKVGYHGTLNFCIEKITALIN